MDFNKEIVAFFTKFWVWFCYIIIGWLAKLSYDLVKRRKISFWVAVGSAGMAGFAGFLASVWCINHQSTNGGLIVPVCTLLSDKIFTYLFALDYKRIIDAVMNKP